MSDEPISVESADAPTRVAAPSLMRNVLLNWIGLVISIVYTLLITPAVIHGLDKEGYGIWSLLNAFVGYSSLFYLGLGTSLTRYGAQYYGAADQHAVNRLASVVFSIYTTLGIAFLVTGLALAPSAPHLILSAPRPNDVVAVSATVVVLAARLCLMFVGSVYAGLLVARGRMDLNSIVTICGHVARLIVVPLAVKSGNPLFALALAVGITGALEVAALVVLALRTDPHLKVRLVVPAADELRTLYGFGVFAFLIQVADRLISYTDTVVIGVMLGAAEAGVYSIPLQLTEYGRTVVRGVVTVLLPHLSALHATGQAAKIRLAYTRTIRVTAIIAAFVVVNLVALGPAFLRLWIGPVFAADALPLLAWLGLAVFAQAVAVQGPMQFCLALGRVRFATSVLLFEGVINLALSIVLARQFGIVGVAAATAIPAVLVSAVILPIYVARFVGASLRELLRRTVVPITAFTIVLMAAETLLKFVIPIESYLVLSLRLALTGLVAALAIWLLAEDSERRMIRVLVERRRRR